MRARSPRPNVPPGSRNWSRERENPKHVIARPLGRAAIRDLRLVARLRTANSHVVDADRREQLQPLLRRGNLHSSLGGQFQFNRRRGMQRPRRTVHAIVSSRNQAESHSASIALQ